MSTASLQPLEMKSVGNSVRGERERRGEGHIDNMKTIDYEIKQANER